MSTSFTRTLCRAAVTLALIATVVIPSTSASAAPGDSYVSLGDSFTSGPLIPNQSLDPLGCLRSDSNYPRVAAAARSLVLTDRSCSGATTTNLTTQQNVTPGPNPPQFDSLTTSTNVVTMGMGGNDIGFSDIVLSCIAITPFGPTCKGKWVVNGVDTIQQRIDATAPKIANAIVGIRARSPQAKVFLVGYPAILPDTGLGCWPQMPIAWSDVSYLRSKEKALNTMLSQQAAANGATFVDTYTPSIAKNACTSSSVRWVEPVVPTNLAAPVHPNARGMQGIGNVLASYLAAAGI